MRGRLIGPKTWDQIVGIFEAHWTVSECVGAVLGVCFINCEINCMLVRMRPEMAMDFRFTSETDDWVIGREQ